ncbi:MAG: hypothetical protein ACI4P5_03515 [Candidatus Fimadaptatus sp.]
MMGLSHQSQARLEAWWNNEGFDARPCIMAWLPSEGALPELQYGDDAFWLEPECMLRVRGQYLESITGYGEAARSMYMDFGANAMALQLGARALWSDTSTIWAEPVLSNIRQVAECMPGQSWQALEHKAIELCLESYGQMALTSSYCLGAPADLSAALMGTEKLLYALVDEPEECARAFEHIKRIIADEFALLDDMCRRKGGRLNGWHGIWAPGATTPLQEDFSCMIGEEMFHRFCVPHIRDLASMTPYSFYHLDGPGALRHLDALLEIDELRAIQWQPGEGRLRMGEWVNVLKRILDAGKSCQVYACADDVFMLDRELGPERMLYIVTDTGKNVRELVDRYRLSGWDDAGC